VAVGEGCAEGAALNVSVGVGVIVGVGARLFTDGFPAQEMAIKARINVIAAISIIVLRITILRILTIYHSIPRDKIQMLHNIVRLLPVR